MDSVFLRRPSGNDGVFVKLSQSPTGQVRGQSRQRELNPQPRLYESRALPLSYVGASEFAGETQILDRRAALVKKSSFDANH